MLQAGHRLCLGLALVAVLWLAPSAAQGSQGAQGAQHQPGRELFVSSCASCHGADAAGTASGPSLLGVGSAMVDFQLRTGRMPLADPGVQPKRKPPVFDEKEIAAIVSYVTSLDPGGPSIPTVDPKSGDLTVGQSLFVSNCAPCHGATATGGAVGKGALAPSLSLAAPIEIAEAVVSGPGEMPVFEFSDHELNSIVRFLGFLEHRPDRGGADIGGVGPVPEGFVAWSLGMGACFAIAFLLGHHRPKSPSSVEPTGREKRS